MDDHLPKVWLFRFDLLWGQDANVQTWRGIPPIEMARNVRQSKQGIPPGYVKIASEHGHL